MIDPALIQADAPHAQPLARFSHEAMACTFEVWIHQDDREQARHAAHVAFNEADRIEQELSRFVQQSDVSKINRCSAGETVRVGIEAMECLSLALRIQQETHGAFDVTCSANPTATSAHPAMRIDEQEYTTTVLRDDVRVDLGGIGKGYAVDKMAEILSEWGIARGVVHAGQSTVIAVASADEDPDWTVSLRHPAEPDTHSTNLDETDPPARHRSASSVGRVHLGRSAFSGSGRSIHGSHIIDPRTSRPVAGPIAAWALAPTAAEADALSTALMVMTMPEVEAYFASRTDVAGLLALPPANAPHLHGWNGLGSDRL